MMLLEEKSPPIGKKNAVENQTMTFVDAIYLSPARSLHCFPNREAVSMNILAVFNTDLHQNCSTGSNVIGETPFHFLEYCPTSSNSVVLRSSTVCAAANANRRTHD
jgi:hypothetical protein